MKNRKLLYILVPAVFIIWGIILYRIFSWLGNDKREYSGSVSVLKSSHLPTTPDTFSLRLNYPDPFGFHSLADRKINSSGGKIIREKKWPPISFYGTVSDGKKKKIFASLRISGNDMVLKPGDTCNGIKLLKVKGDKILIGYQGEVHEITREPETR